tara:strand:+ start:2025 stop:2744 length:720 start_codon:yes stop_codon:yes gene_type:complete
MPPKKTNKRKSNKKKISMPKIKILPKNNNMLSSSLLLFLITIAAIINVFYLWTNQDNESLFLFILIAFIVYTEERQKNMILVLGIPFVVVNLLIYARKQFNSEGFEDISGGCDVFLTDASEEDISRCKQLMTGDSTPELMMSWVKGPERFIPTTDISFDGPFRDRVILINNRTDPNTDDDNKQYIKEKIVQHINNNKTSLAPSELFKKYFEYLSDRSGGGGGGGGGDDGGGTVDDLDDD